MNDDKQVERGDACGVSHESPLQPLPGSPEGPPRSLGELKYTKNLINNSLIYIQEYGAIIVLL